jgi:hypothetical protein
VLEELKRCFGEVEVPEHIRGSEKVRSLSSDGVYFLGRILSTWNDDPKYVNTMGEPIALAIEGETPSFAELFKAARLIVPKGADELTIDEAANQLVQRGAAAIDGSGKIQALKEAITTNVKESVSVGPNLKYIADFASVVAENAIVSDVPIFQKVAKENHIPASAIPMLNALIEEKGMELLIEIDNFLVDSQKEGLNEAKKVSAGVGVYMIMSREQSGS